MRCALLTVAGLLAGAGSAGAQPACGEYGTTVHFEKSPSAAARLALKEEKLVFVLHVSGHFEESEFT